MPGVCMQCTIGVQVGCKFSVEVSWIVAGMMCGVFLVDTEHSFIEDLCFIWAARSFLVL